MTKQQVPLERWVEEIVKRTVAEHVASCPMSPRVQRLEVRLSSLMAFMVGSGGLGGAAGGVIVKLLGG